MKLISRFFLAIVPGLILSSAAIASTHYVDLNSTSPASPYGDWSTAASTIQDAVDAAVDGDLIQVTNGVYSTGGRPVNGFALTNRVAVTKRLTLQSVNGPAVTAIQGYQMPGMTNGDAAVRCIYLTNNAALIGFTLFNGATRTNNADFLNEQCGGGAWCNDASVLISNCVLTANSAGDSGGGAFQGTLANCVVSSNSVPDVGGGSYQSSLNDCTVVGNFSANGGAGSGAFWWDTGSMILNRCLIAGNVSSNSSAGVYGGVLTQCVLSNNAVINGAVGGGSGGADSATLDRCLLIGNSADYGGAAQSSYLYNCIITNNSATQYGGGVRSCTVLNSTIVNNTAGAAGGGADSCELDNCIVYFNSASSNANFTLGSCTFNNSCTTPTPDNGAGNITADPLFVDTARDLHLQGGSPCINAGTNSYVTTHTNDFEGKPRIIGLVVDMGALEFPMPVAISASFTNVSVGYVVTFVAQVYAGNDSVFRIDFGDGTVVSNQLNVAHSWNAPGDYLVSLTAFSSAYPGGISTNLTIHVAAGMYFVSLDSANPLPPYASWDTAAANIQDAIDAVAQPTATVLVSNGTYNAGGRTVNGYGLTNRVVVNKAVALVAVNGPSVTAIVGYQMPTNIYGDSAIRCLYMTNGSSLIGFTVANGATRSAGDWFHEQDGGGVWCETTNVFFSNCVFAANAAWDAGGGIARGTLVNCLLTSNFTANVGGGALSSRMSNCVMAANSADYWGGGYYDDPWATTAATLSHCLLKDNYAAYSGGGTYGGTFDHCLITNNLATDDYYHDGYSDGGGATEAVLYNCVVTGNRATGYQSYGAGCQNCNLYDSLICNNTSEAYGGGLGYCIGANCTIVGNSAGISGGGLEGSEMQNCIIYYNTAAQGANYHGSGCSSCDAMDYCVTTPLPPPGVGGGLGNVTDEPLLADIRHIAANSPCRGIGVAAYTVGSDIDDEAWFLPPSRGCDEYHAGAITGPLDVSIQSSYTNATRGFQLHLAANIGGHASLSRWDLGDGTIITNHPFISHIWTAAGDYTVTLTAYNEQYPAGVSGTFTVHISGPAVYYVDAGNANPVAPYSSWATAATNIQDAIDAAAPLSLILVTNGTYQAGGRVVHGVSTNRVAITKPVMVQSVNGPYVTSIDGGNTMRCVYLTNDATLAGFTLSRGATLNSGDSLFDKSGGGAWCQSGQAVLFNCIVSGNTANVDGGGVLGGTLYNCALIGNSAAGNGGAANSSSLYNCTVTGNSAADAGGVYSCMAWNSIVAYNAAAGTHPDFYTSTFSYSCLQVAPADGTGNLITAPGLVDSFHLAASSPCRGSGNAAFVAGADIDGQPWGAPPSIGCDEYYAGATGALTVTLQAQYTNVVVNFPVALQAQISGHAASNVWDFADGTSATNQLAVSHAWSTPGDYLVTVTAYNDDNPSGVSGTIALHVSQGFYYVARNNPSPAAPYDTWATAATNIQDAVDAAFIGSTVLISNGVYNAGGATASGASNRVTVLKQLALQGVNGPGTVLIDAAQTMRGVYLTNLATLAGVTVSNGNAGGVLGAAASFATVSNCVIIGNSGSGVSQCTVYGSYIARNSAYSGGGASGCILNNCFLAGNLCTGDYGWGGGAVGGILNSCILSNNASTGAQGSGGGAAAAVLNDCLVIGNSGKSSGGIDYSTIYNCTIVSNSAGGAGWSWGGGVGNSTMTNSIIYYNSSPSAPNIGYSSSAAYCCAPDAVTGPGNFTNAPAFVNPAANDFHLATNSPCINAGINAYATNVTDFDGNPRIAGGTVDIGAFEFQSPTSLLSYAWAQQYGLPTDGSADYLDTDGDGMNNWQEWKAGTNPTNANSVLKLVCVAATNASGATITWLGVSGKLYSVEACTNLTAQPAFQVLQSGIAGQPGTMSYTDTTFTNASPVFYRVQVQ